MINQTDVAGASMHPIVTMPFTPYYNEDGITIYLGDNRKILPFIEKCDLILTDPPYGISFAHGGNDNSFVGVSFSKAQNLWVAFINGDSGLMILGRFRTIEEAIECRKAANVKHGYHEMHGGK